ncbi:MAG: HNH endonuclease [Symploca sp. SIO2G7]|nr:HNH endonuclease [Symploca sp. SIO2G7]
MPTRKASLLKRQKGKCPWCYLHFREEDTLEGKDEYKNLQVLHGHCHDEKTASDMEDIRKRQSTQRLKLINQELDQLVWYWKDDILVASC